MKIKAAIFDMDGTLVDSLMFWDMLWAELGKKYLKNESFRPTEADDKAVRTLTMRDAMELIHQKYGIGSDGMALTDEVNRMISDFYTYKVGLKKGTLEFLERLHKEGVRMVIASATAPEYVELALTNCKIKQYFEKIFSCTDFGKGKEAPDVFIGAQKYLGEKIEDTWVFEDSAVAIQTAHKAGFKTVGIYDKYNYGQDIIQNTADYYIAENEDITSFFAK